MTVFVDGITDGLCSCYIIVLLETDNNNVLKLLLAGYHCFEEAAYC